MKIRNLLFTGLLAIAFASCSSDDDNNQPMGAYDNGILILNEGSFNNSNASVSYVPMDLSSIENNIFSATNNGNLGDVAQSIGFHGNEAWIVVNNSSKIEVVDRYTFEHIATIEMGLVNPRYFTVANGKGYVTDWGDPTAGFDDYVAIIDLENYSYDGYILVSEGPERIVEHNGKLYVSHLGGYNTNNVVSVIDDTNVTEITVNDNPDEMIIDEAGNLWVLSQGITDWSGNGADTPGAIHKINTANNQVEQTLEFEAVNHPDLMVYENGMIYYAAGGEIFRIENSATTLSDEAILNGFFYGMEVRDGLLYATDAGDFASQGSFHVFDVETGTEVASFNTGIAPGRIYFN